MRHTIVAASAALAASVLLAGCGDTTGGQQTGGPETGAAPPQPSATTPSPRPTGPPWPGYPVDDYRYELRVTCFCPDAGVPLKVTVRNGKVADAVYAARGRGHDAGDPVTSKWLRLTIDDIIDNANDPDYDQVKVRWPEDQAYPSSVSIDRVKRAVDDEIGYQIRDVQPLESSAVAS